MVDLASRVVAIPDFPQAGILFRDIMPLLRSDFRPTIDALGERLSADEWASIDVVVGVESRGFILAAALAERFDKGFVTVRKAGKLPPPVVSSSYALEYGTGVLELQRGDGRAVVVDDVLATGGTLSAAADLCESAGYAVTQLLVLVDLGLVVDYRWRGHEARSVIQYGAAAMESSR